MPFYSLIGFLAGIAFGYLLRMLIRKNSSTKIRKSGKNIGTSDRIVRMIIAVGLLLWAAYANWSPLLLFFSGFTFYEIFTKWCGFYAALGKNSCPLE